MVENTSQTRITPIRTRSDLGGFAQKPLKKARSWFTPDVVQLDREGERVILKDFSRRAWVVRSTWGRFLIGREVRAYRLLNGVPGIPRLIAVLDPYAFVMEFVDAGPLPRRREKDRVGLEYFSHLEKTMQEMHARGVAHGDVRRRNILISHQRTPYIIDFESAIFDGRWLWRRFFHSMVRVDELTVLKIRHKYYPEETTSEELLRLARVPLFLRLGRFVRQNLYGPLSPKIMKARFRRLRAHMLTRDKVSSDKKK